MALNVSLPEIRKIVTETPELQELSSTYMKQKDVPSGSRFYTQLFNTLKTTSKDPRDVFDDKTLRAFLQTLSEGKVKATDADNTFVQYLKFPSEYVG